MRTRSFLFILLLAVFAESVAYGHPGGLDAKGGHYNRKTGEYHYHRKPPEPPVQAPPKQTITSTPVLATPTTFPNLKSRLFQCRVIQDSLARLICYDILSDSLPPDGGR